MYQRVGVAEMSNSGECLDKSVEDTKEDKTLFVKGRAV